VLAYAPRAGQRALALHAPRAAAELLSHAIEAAERLGRAAREPDHGGESARRAFRAALEDDLDTPKTIEVLESTRGSTLRELGGVLGLTLA
jgi:cysteinyl-tRNA synthetase